MNIATRCGVDVSRLIYYGGVDPIQTHMIIGDLKRLICRYRVVVILFEKQAVETMTFRDDSATACFFTLTMVHENLLRLEVRK